MQDLGTLDGDVLSIGLGLNDSGIATGFPRMPIQRVPGIHLARRRDDGLEQPDPSDVESVLAYSLSINARGEIIGFQWTSREIYTRISHSADGG